MNQKKKNVFCLLFCLIFLFTWNGQAGPRAWTYSIVAWDEAQGEMGVAVQSHWFSVGSVVPWAESDVGVIATQSFVNISFGPRGLDLLKQGKFAEEALKILIESDEGRDFRQLAVLDAKGRVAVYTGEKCIPEAGHAMGDHFSVQANLMLKNTVWQAMKEAFEKSRGPLAERMLCALEAGQKEGGDLRGCQSASLLVVRIQSTGKPWEDKCLDLRVEDHPQPLQELRRLLKIFRAYESMNQGDLAMERNDLEGARFHYGNALTLYPENPEVKFWYAVALVNLGDVGNALPLFRSVFKEEENWRILVPRLVPIGVLKMASSQLEQILNIK